MNQAKCITKLGVFLLAACMLFGQGSKEREPGSASLDGRISKLEGIVPELEKKIDEQSAEIKLMRDQLTVITTKLDFVQWIGSGIGLLLLISIYNSVARAVDNKGSLQSKDRELLEQVRGLMEKTTKG